MAFVFTPGLLYAATRDLDVLFHTESPEPYDRDWTTRVLIWVEKTIETTGIEKTVLLDDNNTPEEVIPSPPQPDNSSQQYNNHKKKKSITLCAPPDIRHDIITKMQQAVSELESPSSKSEKKEDHSYVDGKIFIQPQIRARLLWDVLVKEWLTPPIRSLGDNSGSSSAVKKIDKIFAYPHPNTSDYSLEDPKTGMPYETKRGLKMHPSAPIEILHISNSGRTIIQPLLIPYRSPHNLNMVLSSPFSQEKFHNFSIEYTKYNWRFRPQLHLMRSDSLDSHATAEAIFVSGQCSDMSLTDIRSTDNPYICIHARRYMTTEQREKLHSTPLHEDLPIFIKTAPDFLEITCVEIAVRHQLLSERLLQKTCETLYETFMQNYKLHS